MSKTVSGIRHNCSVMAARVTLKAINDELSRRGHNARLAKASGYFYFFGGEATDWIRSGVGDREVGTAHGLRLGLPADDAFPVGVGGGGSVVEEQREAEDFRGAFGDGICSSNR